MLISYLCLQATREGQASHAHVHEIINGLREDGCNVDLYEPSYVKKEKLPGALGRLLGVFFTQIKLILNIKKYKLIYIRAHFFSGFTAFFARIMKIPYVVEVNGPVDDGKDVWVPIKFLLPMIKFLRNFEVKNASGVIAVTPKMRENLMLEYNINNVAMIPNGANDKLFNPIRRTEEKLIIDSYVVFVGVMAKWQGIDKIIDGVLSNKWPSNVKAVFVGDGIDRSLVEDAVEKSNRIIYLGKQPYKKIGPIIANSLASLALIGKAGTRGNIGASPLKLFEGMASGVPIIATDLDYMGDIVKEFNCGIVLPVNYTPNDLSNAVNFLSENPIIANEMGINGRKAIETKHSWKCRATETYKYLKSIIN